MARILHSDAAPSEKVHYSFAGVEFDISGTGGYESTDPVVLSNAESHPWLHVEYPAPAEVEPQGVDRIAPEDDPMSRVNDNSNDPEAVARAVKREAVIEPVAIDAGETQTKVVETGNIAETLAADEGSKTAKKGKS